MPEENDLQQPATGDSNATPASSITAPVGQSSNSGENWEDRFKGMQRKYSHLETQVNAKDEVAKQALAEKKAAEQRAAQIATDYEQKLQEAISEASQKSTEAQQYEARIQKLEADLAERAVRDTLRKELTTSHADLLPWFESGYLKPVAEDGQPLQGEALDEFVTGFRSMLGNNAESSFRQAMQGTTPPGLGSTQKASVGGMTPQEMSTFLNNPANISHPNRQAVKDAYLNAVSGNQGTQFGTDSDWLNQS